MLSAANKLLFDPKYEWPVSDHGLVTGQGAGGEAELLLEDEGAADEVGEEEDEPAGQELGGGQHQGLGQTHRDTQHPMQGLELESGGHDSESLQGLLLVLASLGGFVSLQWYPGVRKNKLAARKKGIWKKFKSQQKRKKKIL